MSSIVMSNLHGHAVPGGPVEISRLFLCCGPEIRSHKPRSFSSATYVFSVWVRETFTCVLVSPTHTEKPAVPELVLSCSRLCLVENSPQAQLPLLQYFTQLLIKLWWRQFANTWTYLSPTDCDLWVVYSFDEDLSPGVHRSLATYVKNM